MLKSIWLLDATWSEETLKGPVLRARTRRIRWLRHSVQIGFAAIVCWIGVAFVAWVRSMEAGSLSAPRPSGVEAFLPISGLISLRYFFTTGTVHSVHPAALVLLVAILTASVLLKKAFCSWVCPVGTMSEVLAQMSLRLFRRRLKLPRVIDIPFRGVKYLLLLFFVYAVFFAMSADALQAFLASPYNQIADVKMLDFFARPSPPTVKVLSALVLLSVAVPYAWCRYLCPYGALLGIASLFSPLKVTRDPQTCIDCGLCTKACPSHLPVERLSRVSSDECVGCLSCVAACPVTRALRVEAPRPMSSPIRPAVFALILVAIFTIAIGGARVLGIWNSRINNAEFSDRIRQRDLPQYEHVR